MNRPILMSVLLVATAVWSYVRSASADEELAIDQVLTTFYEGRNDSWREAYRSAPPRQQVEATASLPPHGSRRNALGTISLPRH